MEISEFKDLAGKINFIGRALQKINVGIDMWAYPVSDSDSVRPLHTGPRYTVRYLYASSQNESTQVISGSAASPNEAITAAFAQWLAKEFGALPAPTSPEVIQLKKQTA